METTKQLRVLIAAAPISVNALIDALSDEHELVFVSSLAEAATYSYDAIDVIVCGLYFDESRMFDLLRYAQLHPMVRTLPFICVNAVDHDLTKPIAQGIEIACRALGAVGFVDFSQWCSKHGTLVARSKLHQLIRDVAHPA